MVDGLRILHHPVLSVKPGPAIHFFFNGRRLRAREGESVAAALYAAGVRIFSRSFKYHRPRGLFCLSGRCSHCLMRVDGVPNVRICRERVRPGMRVESQNAWPCLRLDAAALAGLFSPLIRPGFQYRRFIRPRGLYHLWEGFLRRMAGIGSLAEPQSVVQARRRDAQPELLVVGAGAAGLSAAWHAAQSGARVWVVEREARLGGRRLYDTALVTDPETKTRRHAVTHVSELATRLEGLESCRIVREATAFGWYDEDILAVMAPGELWDLRPQRTILATGSYETPMTFANNDLPGVFLAEGLQRLMHRDFLRPGRRAAVATEDDRGYAVALELVAVGVEVAAVIDRREQDRAGRSPQAREAQPQGVPVFHSHRLRAALGKRRVRAAVFEACGPRATGRPLKLACDVLCTVGPRMPANELLFQRTCEGKYILESPYQYTRAAQRSPDLRAAPDLYVVGGAGGTYDLGRACLEGRIAGLSAALELGHGREEHRAALAAAREALASA